MPDDSDDLHQLAQEASEIAQFEKLTHHVARIRESVSDTRDDIKELAKQITRLVVIEERQHHDRQALERAFNAIAEMGKKHDQSVSKCMEMAEKMDARLRAIELLSPTTKRATDTVHNVTWLLVAAFVGALITKVFKVAT
jgi:DNA repair ATPase RecN